MTENTNASMLVEESPNQNNLPPDDKSKVFDRVKTYLKEHLLTILSGLISGSVIAYISSRFFIKSYLTNIGFEGLIYNASMNNETVSSLTLGIFSILLVFLYTFCFVTMILRFLYHEIRPTFESFHSNHTKFINWFFVVSLLVPLGILPLIYFDKNQFIQYYMWISFFPSLLFIGILIEKVFLHKNGFTTANALSLLHNGLLFGGISFLAFAPFLLIAQSVINTHIIDWLSYGIIIVVWGFFAWFNGFRITSDKPIEYLLDFTVAFVVVFEILILSSNTIKLPIAEFVGIKDSKSQIYKLTEKDYSDVKNDINTFWLNTKKQTSQSNQPNCQKQDLSEDKTCYLLLATNSASKDVYLQAQVIFRDNDNSVLCPPNFRFNENAVKQCFVVESKLLHFTPQTFDSLQDNQEFVKEYHSMDLP